MPWIGNCDVPAENILAVVGVDLGDRDAIVVTVVTQRWQEFQLSGLQGVMEYQPQLVTHRQDYVINNPAEIERFMAGWREGGTMEPPTP